MTKEVKCPFCEKYIKKRTASCECGYYFDLKEYSQSLEDLGQIISSHSASLSGILVFGILCVSITIFGIIIIVALDYEKATHFAVVSIWGTISFSISFLVMIKRYKTKIDIHEKGMHFRTGLRSYRIRFDRIVDTKAISANHLPPDITVIYDEVDFNKTVVIPTKYFSDHMEICRVLGYG